MKENPIPTKDLKTGMKVTGKILEGIYKPLEPHLKRAAAKGVRNILEAFDKRV